MHDPLVVAFEIRRPWPKRTTPLFKDTRWRFRGSHWAIAGRWFRWPSLITVWHREPGGRDSGEVCKHYHRVQDAKGKWQTVFHRSWRFHVHHWKKGGPYDDDAYCAGWHMGSLDARLEPRWLAKVSETIRTADKAQADLLAMKHRYSLRLTDSGFDEWTFAEFVRIDEPSGGSIRMGESYDRTC